MASTLKEELLLLLAITIVAIAAAVVSGKLLLFLLLGLLAYLTWHLFHLFHLPTLLNGSPPSPGMYRPYGLWKSVYENIDTLHAATRQRENKLTQLQVQFQDAFSALPNAVIILGQEARINWMNPVAERLFDVNYPDVYGQLFLHHVRDPILKEYLDNKNFQQPLVFNPPASRTKVVSMFVTPLSGQQQLIVTTDITRQYHLDTAQKDFVANISHELRTPLTVISGLLEQVQTEDSTHTIENRSIELMQKQTARMTELIADLLTLSHLELNEHPPLEEEINVAELLTIIVDEARTISRSTGHIIQLNVESQTNLKGDWKELRIAISNLVFNAIRHTPNRTEIFINWKDNDDGAYLSVSDNGEGISARHLPRLTERLYRVDTSRSRDTEGTGLGLAIVKHILDRQTAELEINSTVGRGSTFTCHFPVEKLL